MNANISEEDYKAIEELIGSEKSVVGIDAKKTHIIIIHMLREIQNNISGIENRLSDIEDKI